MVKIKALIVTLFVCLIEGQILNFIKLSNRHQLKIQK
jgi:hypothetical protein